jgi:hypothetical protein
MSRTLNKPGIANKTSSSSLKTPPSQSWKDKLHPEDY